MNQRQLFTVLAVVITIIVVAIQYLNTESPWFTSLKTTVQRPSKGNVSKLRLNLRPTSTTNLQYSDNSTGSILLGLTKPSKEYITEFEALKDGPLTDIEKTVSVAKSSVKLKAGRKNYSVGEAIELTISLRTGFNLNRTRGGDKLRVRIYNNTLQAFAPGYVIDHYNGTYTAVVRTHWPGKQMISVILAYRREAVRAMYYIRKKIPSTRTIDAVFRNGKKEAATACHPVRSWLTEFKEVCNLTFTNGGMSWYCGKPRNGLKCQDWSFTKYASTPPILPLTPAEHRLFPKKWEVFPEVIVNVNGDLQERNHLPPCHSYPRHMLWNKVEPTGFFYNNTWHLLHCQAPGYSVYRQCLNRTRLMISGDSTSRQWYRFFQQNLQCKQITEKWTTKKWHRKSICIVPAINFTLEWLPHAQPFFPGEEWDNQKYAIHSIAKNIDSLKYSSTKTYFVIHMHMHMTAFHHSIFRDRMKRISKSVRDILKINKNVIFLIKGPHTYIRAKQLDDYNGYIYNDIMFEEFQGLHDKIVFMDQKDMTIAKALIKNHPPMDVVREAVFQILDYVCERPH